MDLNLDINKRLFLLFSFLGSTVHVFFFSKSSKKEFHKWKPNTAVSIVIQVLLALCL